MGLENTIMIIQLDRSDCGEFYCSTRRLILVKGKPSENHATSMQTTVNHCENVVLYVTRFSNTNSRVLWRFSPLNLIDRYWKTVLNILMNFWSVAFRYLLEIGSKILPCDGRITSLDSVNFPVCNLFKTVLRCQPAALRTSWGPPGRYGSWSTCLLLVVVPTTSHANRSNLFRIHFFRRFRVNRFQLLLSQVYSWIYA